MVLKSFNPYELIPAVNLNIGRRLRKASTMGVKGLSLELFIHLTIKNVWFQSQKAFSRSWNKIMYITENPFEMIYVLEHAPGGENLYETKCSYFIAYSPRVPGVLRYLFIFAYFPILDLSRYKNIPYRISYFLNVNILNWMIYHFDDLKKIFSIHIYLGFNIISSLKTKVLRPKWFFVMILNGKQL